MDLKIPYVAVKSPHQAFKIVEEFLKADGLSSIPVKPSFQFMPEKNLIIAEGSGFKISALFEPEYLAISVDLSLLYRAFKGKIITLLEQQFKKRL
jgi:hypothetical protein